MNIPDNISESLETIFWVKILKFFDAYPDPVYRILTLFPSGIQDKHTGSATLILGWIQIRIQGFDDQIFTAKKKIFDVFWPGWGISERGIQPLRVLAFCLAGQTAAGAYTGIVCEDETPLEDNVSTTNPNGNPRCVNGVRIN